MTFNGFLMKRMVWHSRQQMEVVERFSVAVKSVADYQLQWPEFIGSISLCVPYWDHFYFP